MLGFPVMGIWPKDSDGTDVNAVDRSPSLRRVLFHSTPAAVVPSRAPRPSFESQKADRVGGNARTDATGYCTLCALLRYLVTADDFGTLKLFNYPAIVKHQARPAPSLHRQLV